MKTTAKNDCGPSSNQIKIIHTLKSKLKLDDDTYRMSLQQSFGVSSSKMLTYSQAEGLIDALEKEAVRRGVWTVSPNKYEQPGVLQGMASRHQLNLINFLWGTVSRATDDKSRRTGLRTFLAKTVKASDQRFLTMANASKVIEILKQMKERADVAKRQAT